MEQKEVRLAGGGPEGRSLQRQLDLGLGAERRAHGITRAQRHQPGLDTDGSKESTGAATPLPGPWAPLNEQWGLGQ